MSDRTPTIDDDGSPDNLDERLRQHLVDSAAAGPPAPSWDDVQATRSLPNRTPVLVAAAAFVLIVLAGVVVGTRSDHQTPAGDPRVGPVALEEGEPFTVGLRAVADPPLPMGDPQRVWTESTGVWTGAEYIVWGGWRDGAPRNDGVAYNPVTDQWRVIPAAPINGRWKHHAVWTGTEMLVFGGDTEWNGKDRSIEGAVYDPAKDAWRRIADAPAAAAGRVYRKALWHDGRLVLGVPTDAAMAPAPGATEPLLVYDPRTDVWTEIVTPILRDFTAMPSGLVGVVAPERYEDPVALAHVDLANGAVTTLTTVPWGERVTRSQVTSDGRQIIVLAVGTQGQAQVGWFDPESRQWTRSYSLPTERSLYTRLSMWMQNSVDLRWLGGHLAVLGDGQLDLIDPRTGEVHEGRFENRRHCIAINAATVWTGQEWFTFGNPAACQDTSDGFVARVQPGAR